jgi:hypothetical protein
MVYLKNIGAVLCVGLLALATGCNQNPYEGTGTLVLTKPQLPPLETTFLIDAPDSVDCNENEECWAYVKGYVPDTGNAVLSIEGLPPGATYHADSGKLDYTPDFSIVDLAADPTVTEKTFNLTLVVRSTEDLTREITRSFPLVVHNSFRPMTATISGTTSVNEGTLITQDLTVQNLDYPNGPYDVSLENGPTGAQIIADPANPLHYTVQFTPSFATATLQNPTANFSFNFLIKTPDGNLLRRAQSWQVNDLRQVPVLVSPNDITVSVQNPVFTLILSDPNGEVTPNLGIGQDPAFGTLALSPVAGQPGSVKITWNGLSAANVGMTTVLSFTTCALTALGAQTYCTEKQVTVHLTN